MWETRNITCIVCPVGCDIKVEGKGDQIKSITGYGCKRGEEYARGEFICPVRILTTTVKVEGSKVPLVPVRSDKPIPKEMLLKCMEEICKHSVKTPVKCYDVIIPNILGTGSNIVATANVK